MWIARAAVFFNVLISTIKTGLMVITILQEFKKHVLETQNRAQLFHAIRQVQPIVGSKALRAWF
jgi:hypothetical protein